MSRTPSTNSNSGSLRSLLDQAIRLRRAGRIEQAIVLLERLGREYPKSAAVAGYLGGAYFDLDQPTKAAKYFRRATKLSPRSELASLGLFHSLWSVDAIDAAFAEMRRFLKRADSKEYAKLLRDLAVEGRLVPQLSGAA
jgi:tetratricopeptide (TPR) repeat protein